MACSAKTVSIPIKKYYKDRLSLLENMMKVLSKGVPSEATIGNSSAAKSTTFTGNKRSS